MSVHLITKGGCPGFCTFPTLPVQQDTHKQQLAVQGWVSKFRVY